MPEIWRSSMLRFSAFKHFPIFASGMLVYHLFMSFNVEKRDAGDYKGYGNVLLMTGVLLYEALTQNWLPSFFGDMYYWQGLVYGCIFLGLGLSPWSWAVNKGTRLLGKISYSVYLNHTTVIFLMTPIYRWLYLNSLTLTLAFLISLLLTFAVVLPISALTYRFIELPGIAAGKWVIARINQKNAGVRTSKK